MYRRYTTLSSDNTVCYSMLRLHPHCMYSAAASRLTCTSIDAVSRKIPTLVYSARAVTLSLWTL